MSSNPLRQALGLPALKLNWAEENINEAAPDTTGQYPSIGGGGLGGSSIASLAGYQGKVNEERTSANKAKEKPTKLWIDAIGRTVDAENIPLESLQELFRSASERNELLAGFNNERARIEAEIARKQANPVMTVLTTMAGEMAQAEGLNPLVRAMGRTARSLAKTPDELREQAQKIAMATEPIRRGKEQAFSEIADVAVKMELRKQAEDQRLQQQANSNIVHYRQQIAQLIAVVEPTDKAGLLRLMQMAIEDGKEMNIPPSIITSSIEAIRAKATSVEGHREQDIKMQGMITDRQIAAAKTTASIGMTRETYKEKNFDKDDFVKLANARKSDMAVDRFIEEHKKSGGPFVGKAVDLLAFFGNQDAQNLIQAQAESNMAYITSSGTSLAKLSENEGKMLLGQMMTKTTGAQAAVWAARFKQWNNDVRQAMLIEKYAGNINHVRHLLPNKPFNSLDRTKSYNTWDDFVKDRDKNLLSPDERAVQKFPMVAARMAAEGNVSTFEPLVDSRGIQRYTDDGREIWVDRKNPKKLLDSNGNPLLGADGKPYVPKKQGK